MDPSDHDELSTRRAAVRRARSLVTYRDESRQVTVVVNIEQYRWLGEIEVALACATWGELRATAPLDIFLEILDFAGFGDLADELYPFVETGCTRAEMVSHVNVWEVRTQRHVPSDAEAFFGEDLDPVAGGVYPPDPWMLMRESLTERAFDWYERNWRACRAVGGDDRVIVGKLLGELERVGYRIEGGTDVSARRRGRSMAGERSAG
jgi:hypothetical protein